LCLRTPAEGIVISRLRVRAPTRGTLSRRGISFSLSSNPRGGGCNQSVARSSPHKGDAVAPGAFFLCLRTHGEEVVISRLRVRAPTRGTLSRRGHFFFPAFEPPRRGL